MKKRQNRKVGVVSKKRLFNRKNETWQYAAAVAVIVMLATYSIVSVAIDTGSLIAYGASLAGFYYSVLYVKMAIKLVFKNDKNSRARAAKKAH